MATGDRGETAEGHVRRDLGGSEGAAVTGIGQDWRGLDRRGGFGI